METKIFSRLLIINLCDVIIAILLILIAYGTIKVKNDIPAIVLNKIDFILILFWARYFYLYIISVSKKSDEKAFGIIQKIEY